MIETHKRRGRAQISTHLSQTVPYGLIRGQSSSTCALKDPVDQLWQWRWTGAVKGLQTHVRGRLLCSHTMCSSQADARPVLGSGPVQLIGTESALVSDRRTRPRPLTLQADFFLHFQEKRYAGVPFTHGWGMAPKHACKTRSRCVQIQTNQVCNATSWTPLVFTLHNQGGASSSTVS